MGGFLHRDSRLMREFTRALSIDVLLLLLRLLLCDRTYKDRHKLHNVGGGHYYFCTGCTFPFAGNSKNIDSAVRRCNECDPL